MLWSYVLASSIFLVDLPDGVYYYQHRSTSEVILLRKVSQVAIGVKIRPKVDLSATRSENICFQGFIKQNAIANVTQIFPPYTPNARWQYQTGVAIALDKFKLIKSLPHNDVMRDTLMTCIRVFSR